MESADSVYFRDLPPLTADVVAKLRPGHELSLVLLEHIGEGKSALFSVRYIHRELFYRSPGKKDAVALGTARLEDSGDFKEARILFSRPNSTATLRGLALEGQVKEGRVRA
jgi:hypothetical protein